MSTPITRKERRRVVARNSKQPATPLRALALNLSEAARSALTEPFRLTIEHHQIPLQRLPRGLDGFRIVQLSDIHHSAFTSREQIERAVATANNLKPDIVALTGDYVSKERKYAAPCAELLGTLRARYGVYAVLGNHDHWTDAALITDLFRAEGIGDVGHRRLASARTHARFVIVQRLEQIFLALARDARDRLGAGVSIGVA